MGLDMMLYKRMKAKTKRNVKLKMALTLMGEEKKDKEVAYWRKVYVLHEIFLSYDTSEAIDLNCKAIPLSYEDLKEIDKKYPDAQIKKVLKETDWDNFEVYYYAWW